MVGFSASKALDGQYTALDSDHWFDFIEQQYDVPEQELIEELLRASAKLTENQQTVQFSARKLVTQVREDDSSLHAVDKLLQEYSLNSQEGIALMCLAEAMMRVPDKQTLDLLIRDRLSDAHWAEHVGHSDSWLVNASTWGLLLTGKLIEMDELSDSPANWFKHLLGRLGEPMVRSALQQAMKMMAKQFVLGRSLQEAIDNSQSSHKKGYSYSFDMLGEAALTDQDAALYQQAYLNAIRTLGSSMGQWNPQKPRPSISIKLSALHPRYEQNQEETVLVELTESLVNLVQEARTLGVALTIDAEEMDRLELSLKLFTAVFQHPVCQGWGLFGLAVQAYSKRALPVLGYLNALGKTQGDIIPVRLVKGAYWDSEIKHAQVLGLEHYPVFTRKENTDLSYLVCAQFLMGTQINHLQPQFATHNAHTVCSILEMAKQQPRAFEFQRLHGMGEALYDTLLTGVECNVRIYAPVGKHKELLPYLVRRLLENGANTSFVHRLVDANTEVEQLIVSPVSLVKNNPTHANPKIPLPGDIFQPIRTNSKGYNLAAGAHRKPLLIKIDNHPPPAPAHWISGSQAAQCLTTAYEAWPGWRNTCAKNRAKTLEKLADLLEAHTTEFISLCRAEAGKTLQDGIDEVREAVDFCRYYAAIARQHLARPTLLAGPTGETNEHFYEGRGVFLCISPWNFPLAIFVGQVSAALVAGNTVLAKPAEQTSRIAQRATELFHLAGIPHEVLQLLPGDGPTIGGALLSDTRLAGVAFTGSCETAKLIHRKLAQREGSIATLIAETGGQNAMIVDSTALPEQVVTDVLRSAFGSAGQRCSALRVLCLQAEIAPRVIELLKGALKRWKTGNPQDLSTDCGPVIDQAAYENITRHIDQFKTEAKLIAQALAPIDQTIPYLISPTVFEIDSLTRLGPEVFGPVLHVLTYQSSELDTLVQRINEMGFGLTLGIHSRNQTTARRIAAQARVGNCYINRNQIGAVVGVQPFGGQGLSGTGPKAGGPDYIKRFSTERVITTNTTAIGGNASLLSLNEKAS